MRGQHLKADTTAEHDRMVIHRTVDNRGLRHPPSATMEGMTRSPDSTPWILTDPASQLDQILRLGRASIGDTVIAAVDSGNKILGVQRIATPTPRPVPCYRPVGRREAGAGVHDPSARMEPLGDRLKKVTEDLLGPTPRYNQLGPDSRIYMFTVVCRAGYTVQTATEQQYREAWRGSGLFELSDGDVYVVTPHGWTGFMDGRCGLVPFAPKEARLRAV